MNTLIIIITMIVVIHETHVRSRQQHTTNKRCTCVAIRVTDETESDGRVQTSGMLLLLLLHGFGRARRRFWTWDWHTLHCTRTHHTQFISNIYMRVYMNFGGRLNKCFHTHSVPVMHACIRYPLLSIHSQQRLARS